MASDDILLTQATVKRYATSGNRYKTNKHNWFREIHEEARRCALSDLG